MKLNALRENKARVVEAMKTRLDAADAENRELNDEERAANDADLAALESVNRRIGDAVAVQDAERSMDAVTIVGERGLATVPAEARDDTAPTPFDSLGQQMQAIAASTGPGATLDPRLAQLQHYAAAQGSVGVPSEGGFALQPTIGQRIWLRAFETAVALPRTNQQPIGPNSDSFSRMILDEASRKDGSRGGGAIVYWANEGDTVNLSALKWRNNRQELEKLMGLSKISNELMQDDVAMTAWYERVFGDEVGFQGDAGVWDGDGAGKPVGIRNSNAMLTLVRTGDSTSIVVADDVLAMFARMPAGSIMSSIWHVHPFMFQYLPKMVIGDQPVWLPPTGLQAAPYGLLMGRPVVPFEHCEPPGTSGDIAFVDWSQYDTISKGGIRTDWSMHLYFLTDQQAFRIVARLNGEPQWDKPKELLKGTGQEISPFVQLGNAA